MSGINSWRRNEETQEERERASVWSTSLKEAAGGGQGGLGAHEGLGIQEGGEGVN